jgi:hypothetical protein
MSKLAIILNPQPEMECNSYLISAAISEGATIRIDPRVHPSVPRLELNGRKYAVDLFDSSTAYDSPGLEECHIYFKRGYVQADAPAAYLQKIIPFGLNYACRTNAAVLRILSLYLRRSVRLLRPRAFLLAPPPEAFELPATAGYELSVLFQTRIWSSAELGPNDDPQAINGYRIELLRELKKSFGKRFVGGLIPTPEGREHPELITNLPTKSWRYAVWSRRAAIGIYTRGLHGSNAFKLPEYLASSKCIVGQSLVHELPRKLEECHAVCNTIAATVDECDALLSNPRRMEDIRRASWRYYQEHLRYDRRVQALLRLQN